MTIPSPSMLYMVGALIDSRYNENPVYESNEALRADIVKTYRKAVAAFYDLGCRYLQLDDTSWGVFASKEYRQGYIDQGIDVDELCFDCVNLINDIIGDRPDDLKIGLHVCHGNFRSSWFSSGGYEPVAKTLFGQCKIDGFFLEYDSERSGDFSPLRFIKDQKVVLGLITSKFAQLEDKEEVKKRIQEAEQYVKK